MIERSPRTGAKAKLFLCVWAVYLSQNNVHDVLQLPSRCPPPLPPNGMSESDPQGSTSSRANGRLPSDKGEQCVGTQRLLGKIVESCCGKLLVERRIRVAAVSK